MDEYDQTIKLATKTLKTCGNCGKKPSINPAPYLDNPTGTFFIIACSCGIKTVIDTLENNLKRWNKRK